MKQLDIRDLLELREALQAQDLQELQERIDNILHILEAGETVDVTEDGKVIAHVVPVSKSKQVRERGNKAFETFTDQLAAKIGAYLPEKVDAVEIVRDLRREF